MLDKHNISHCKKSKCSGETPSVTLRKNQRDLEERTRAGDGRGKSDDTEFWQLWLQQENYLNRCCLSWMKGNRDRAQEALSRSRIKAWEKWPEFADKVTNSKAWLTQLTRNLCMDLHRESAKLATGIDSFEQIAGAEESSIFASTASPESTILNRELDDRIRSAVSALPSRLRTPFILRCYREMPYQEIAEQLAISSASARKRVEQARKILQNQLQSYVSGLDNSQLPKENCPRETAATKRDAAIDCDRVPKNKKQVMPHQPATAKILKNSGCNSELINYKITAICLEKLPHTWYSLPSLMG